MQTKRTLLGTFCAMLCTCLMVACGNSQSEESSQEMQYIKTSVYYETVLDMYQNPDDYVGKQYHLSGTLYETTDSQTGEVIYSVYGTNPADTDSGIGIELKWDDFSAFTANDAITVEGVLDIDTGTYNGEEVQFLVLRVSKLEKRG